MGIDWTRSSWVGAVVVVPDGSPQASAFNECPNAKSLLKNPPAVWDNTPLTGFKIEKSVSRYSTSNQVWRILDPRNAEFEISTAVLEQIINDATILKGGVIDARCAWAANKNLVVVD